MVKVSPEIKRIADKYCDENGGPPRKREVHRRSGTQYVEELSPGLYDLEAYYLDEVFFSPPKKPKKEKPASPPHPAKPWEKFNPQPKSPRK